VGHAAGDGAVLPAIVSRRWQCAISQEGTPDGEFSARP
jgi:hypothetical protein